MRNNPIERTTGKSEVPASVNSNTTLTRNASEQVITRREGVDEERILDGVRVEGSNEEYTHEGDEGAVEFIEESAIEYIEEGAIEYIEEGAIEYIEEGAIEYIEEGAIEYIEEGAIECIEEDVIDYIEEDTVEYSEEGAIEFIEEGATVERIAGVEVDCAEAAYEEQSKKRTENCSEEATVNHGEKSDQKHVEDESEKRLLSVSDEDAAKSESHKAVKTDGTSGIMISTPSIGTMSALCEKNFESGPEQASNLPQTPKKRTCRFPGCTNTVKSQGHCQRHGARAKRCKAPNCLSQAQGSHEGYCKRHWREFVAPPEHRRASRKTPEELIQVDPVGESVYDEILPSSYAWRQLPDTVLRKLRREKDRETNSFRNKRGRRKRISSSDLRERDEIKRLIVVRTIPIAKYLVENSHLEPGWHRKKERLSRGILPPKSVSAQLDSWEKQLAIFEMALIAGSDASYAKIARYNRLLAHAWGREKGYHKVILDQLCSRRGDLERKKRHDAGMKYSDERRAAYITKLDATMAAKKCMPDSLECKGGSGGVNKKAKISSSPHDDGSGLLQTERQEETVAAPKNPNFTHVLKVAES